MSRSKAPPRIKGPYSERGGTRFRIRVCDLADTEQASRRCHLVTSHLHFLLDSAGDIGKPSIVEISTMQVRG